MNISNFSIIQGNSEQITTTCYIEAIAGLSTIRDLTGYDVYFHVVRGSKKHPVITKRSSSFGSDGVILFDILSSDTENLQPGRYKYEIQGRKGDECFTAIQGTITIQDTYVIPSQQ